VGVCALYYVFTELYLQSILVATEVQTNICVKNDKSNFMDVIQTVALMLTVISLLPLAICLIKMRQLKKYKARATVTNALVTAYEKKRGYKNAAYYLLNIQYTIHTGIQYSGQTISGKKYAAGDYLPLMYLTDDPGNIKTDFGQSLKWLLPISIILIGLIGWFCYWLLNLDYYYSPSP
jgi:hypothetical protein